MDFIRGPALRARPSVPGVHAGERALLHDLKTHASSGPQACSRRSACSERARRPRRELEQQVAPETRVHAGVAQCRAAYWRGARRSARLKRARSPAHPRRTSRRSRTGTATRRARGAIIAHAHVRPFAHRAHESGRRPRFRAGLVALEIEDDVGGGPAAPLRPRGRCRSRIQATSSRRRRRTPARRADAPRRPSRSRAVESSAARALPDVLSIGTPQRRGACKTRTETPGIDRRDSRSNASLGRGRKRTARPGRGTPGAATMDGRIPVNTGRQANTHPGAKPLPADQGTRRRATGTTGPHGSDQPGAARKSTSGARAERDGERHEDHRRDASTGSSSETLITR